MGHEDFRRQHDVKGSSDRTFGLVMAGFFAIVGALPLLWSGGLRWWALAVAGGFGAAALAAPRILAPLNRLWTRFGLLHRIVSRWEGHPNESVNRIFAERFAHRVLQTARGQPLARRSQ